MQTRKQYKKDQSALDPVPVTTDVENNNDVDIMNTQVTDTVDNDVVEEIVLDSETDDDVSVYNEKSGDEVCVENVPSGNKDEELEGNGGMSSRFLEVGSEESVVRESLETLNDDVTDKEGAI